MVPLFSLVERRTERNAPDLPLLSVYRDHGVVLKGSRDDNYNKPGEDLATYRVVRAGDLVFNKMKAWQGSVAVSDFDGIVSPAYLVFRIRGPVLSRFLHHLLRSQPYVELFAQLSYGVRPAQWDLHYEDLRQVPVLLPPLAVQRAVSDFLDHETAALDALIARKQLLRESLLQRRQAVVTAAVAGVPDAGGISTTSRWWPSIAQGRRLVRLRYVVKAIADGPHFSPKYVDPSDGMMFISARNIKVERWALEDAQYVSPEDFAEFSKRVVPRRGDVLYTKGGTTGIARVVDLDVPFQVWVHVAVLKIRPEVVDPYYLAFALNSEPCYAQAQLYTRGATNQDLGLTRMVNIELPLADLDEQRRVAADTRRRVEEMDAVIASIESSVTLLSEYRQALITAAVTGDLNIVAEPEAA